MKAPVYAPAEDSLLLAQGIEKEGKKILAKNPQASFCEVGVGSGVQLDAAKKAGFAHIFGVDINTQAIYVCREKGYDVKKSDCFDSVQKSKTFDLVVCNPPYLPSDPFDKLPDTSGGEKGDEMIKKFLSQVKAHMNPKAIILLITSSFTPKIDFKKAGFTSVVLDEMTLFQETLTLHKLH